MEELLAQLETYLKMQEELPFPEFQAYYKSVITFLRVQFEDLSDEALIQARYICRIVGGNAEQRAGRSRLQAKPFRKINEKCLFWVEAIDYRLQKKGLSTQEIEAMMQNVATAMDTQQS